MLNNILTNFLLKDICDIIYCYIGDYHELCKLGINDPRVVMSIEHNDCDDIDCKLKNSIHEYINVKEMYFSQKCNYIDDDLIELKNIKVLSCASNCHFTDKLLVNLPNLETLETSRSCKFTDTGLRGLKLKKLYCYNYKKFTDTGLEYLANTLTEFDCDRQRSFTDGGFSKLINLKKLDLGLNTNMTDNCFKRLIIKKSKIFHDEINNYKTKINNYKTKMNYNMIKYYKPRYNKLLILECYGHDNLTDECLKYLPKLHTLQCNNTFTDIGLIYVCKTLKYLYNEYNNKFTDYGLSHLKHLKGLYCGKNKNYTDFGLIHLSKLTMLYNENNTNFTNMSLKYLHNLKELSCDLKNGFDDIGLSYLHKLKKLRCGDNIFTKNGFKYLLNTLEELHCGKNIILSKSDIDFLGKIKKLRIYYKQKLIINNMQ
jgi:hypothetical protein